MTTQTIVLAILGSGIVGSFLSFIAARRTNKTAYMESVAETLSEFNDRLKKELNEVREELDRERKLRRSEVFDLSEQLTAERRRSRELEVRISQLERGDAGSSNL